MLDTPVLTDQGKTNSTLWEEPPKSVTFDDNFGRACDIDDPGRNKSSAWETTEFTTTVNLRCPEIPRTKEELWELIAVENWSLPNT